MIHTPELWALLGPFPPQESPFRVRLGEGVCKHGPTSLTLLVFMRKIIFIMGNHFWPRTMHGTSLIDVLYVYNIYLYIYIYNQYTPPLKYNDSKAWGIWPHEMKRSLCLCHASFNWLEFPTPKAKCGKNPKANEFVLHFRFQPLMRIFTKQELLKPLLTKLTQSSRLKPMKISNWRS